MLQLFTCRSKRFLWLFVGLLTACGGGTQSTTTVGTNPTQPVLQQDQPLPLPSVSKNTLIDEMSPAQAVVGMRIGINLGNTLDAPFEGDWALPAQEHYIQAFAQAGFKHVRIPITWDNHIAKEPPYTIDPDFMNRVEQIVDWALANDLYVIMNAHHDDWIKKDYDNIKSRNRFDTIWIRIADHFKNKPAKLMFEILNEPKGMTLAQINQLNKRILSIIRNQTSNRLVIYSSHEYSDIDNLIQTTIPDINDKFLIANFHAYRPPGFALFCTQEWGTEQDKTSLRSVYQKAYDWSVTNNIPIMLNEFGSAKFDFQAPENICTQSQREEFIRYHIAYATEFGIPATFWDDGGSFSTYNRENNSWGPEKDILVEHNLNQ